MKRGTSASPRNTAQQSGSAGVAAAHYRREMGKERQLRRGKTVGCPTVRNPQRHTTTAPHTLHMTVVGLALIALFGFAVYRLIAWGTAGEGRADDSDFNAITTATTGSLIDDDRGIVDPSQDDVDAANDRVAH